MVWVNRLHALVNLTRYAAWWLLGGFLLSRDPALNAGPTGVRMRTLLYVLRFVLAWVVVWALTWELAPTWLLASRTGLQTLLQVIPATVVAVLVLVLGSLFVMAQVTTTLWGSRAPLMLTLDFEVHTMVARPLVLAVASILLAGQVPDTGEPTALVTAGGGNARFGHDPTRHRSGNTPASRSRSVLDAAGLSPVRRRGHRS
ncbi:hypothetical protein LRS13_15880 [Svornostia abyssi]|uniref:Uncharacterized protein n=1 Tax=Svornostia abyssi TaxID=2898438 RepID=A0ABY5PC07_9ACTN|nr:hypothetical protein LRS13_15880 [Parviterribacteraceae bacterium J379]